MKDVTFYFLSFGGVFGLKGEFPPVERTKGRCPATVLLNGMAQKLVPATLPVLVVRKMFSKSRNPPGVKSAPPIRKDSGESFGLSWGASVAGFTPALPFSEALTSCAEAPAPEASRMETCLRNCSSSCCCRVISFCWSARAWRRAFNSVATDASSEADLVLLVFWAVTTPEARSTRIRGRSSLIHRL